MTPPIAERIEAELQRLSAVQHQAARESAALRAALHEWRLGRSTVVIAATLAERGLDPQRVLGVRVLTTEGMP